MTRDEEPGPRAIGVQAAHQAALAHGNGGTLSSQSTALLGSAQTL